MTISDFGKIAKDSIEVRESPLLVLPGVADYFQIQIEGTGTLASPTMVLYKGKDDVSATNLTGSMSIVTGSRVIKTKTITGLVGGSNYAAYIYFTNDGAGQVRKFDIICPKLGVNPSKFPLAYNRYRLLESPILILPGQSFNAEIVVAGYGTIGASPTMSIYKGTVDDSAASLSGAMDVSGRTITLKTISNLKGGSEYLGYVYFTDNGKSTARYFEIITPTLGAY